MIATDIIDYDELVGKQVRHRKTWDVYNVLGINYDLERLELEDVETGEQEVFPFRQSHLLEILDEGDN